jgi:hypothetical protein
MVAKQVASSLSSDVKSSKRCPKNEAAPKPPPRYTRKPFTPSSLIIGTRPISAILTNPWSAQQEKLILNLRGRF